MALYNRACAGDRGDGVFGIFISRPGYDVLSAADENLLLDSEAQSTQLALNGTIPAIANGASSVIAHGFGYKPFVTFQMILGTHYRFPLLNVVTTTPAIVVNVTSSNASFQNTSGATVGVNYQIYTKALE